MNHKVPDTLAEQRRRYIHHLAAQLDQIRALYLELDPTDWQAGEADMLCQALHGLGTAAADYGLDPLSRAACNLKRRLEGMQAADQVPDASAWQSLEDCLDDLQQLARRFSDTRQPEPEAPYTTVGNPPRVHVVEPDQGQARYLRQVLGRAGYQVVVFGTLDDFRAACQDPAQEQPAVLVMNMSFPGGDAAGVGLVDELGPGGRTGFPVVMLSARDDLPARLAAFRAGITRYLLKPVTTGQLLEELDHLTGRQSPSPYRVLLVGEHADACKVQAGVLHGAGMEVRVLDSPLQVLEAVDGFSPDVVILDVQLPGMTGPELAAVLRERDAHQNLPILFLSTDTDLEQQLLALDLGGDDFLVRPVAPEHLVAAVSARARRARRHGSTLRRLETTLYEREREHQALDRHALVSITDAGGSITYANDAFCELSGYRREELLGQNHRLLKSGRHGADFYREMWNTLRSGMIWRGEICNRCKSGRLYWVNATITPFLDRDGKPYQYVSIRNDITALKQSQEELRISKDRLRRGQIFANIGTWDWHIDSGELYWSERIGPLFGYPDGELNTSYENFLAAVHPDDRQQVSDAINDCIERDIPYEIEHRVVWPDGSVRWLLERGAVLRDTAGRAVQMLGVVQDIDDRKRAELALAEGERRLREAQRMARLGNWEADMVSGKLIWSDEIFRIFGHQPGSFEPSVQAFLDAVHPDDVAKVQESERLAAQTGHHDVVHRILRPDNTVRYVHELAHAELDEAGRVVRLSGTVQDISERQAIEMALRDERDRAQRYLDTAQTVMVSLDTGGDIMMINRKGCELLGYQEHELLGRNWFATCLPAPEGMARVYPLFIDIMQGEMHESEYVENPVLCRDGRQRLIAWHNAYLRDKDGRIYGVLSSGEDITERRKAEEALQRAREEAERANQAKSEFLSSMSHELRTPMNAILGFSQLMAYDEGLAEEQRDNVGEIIKAGNHLLELINEVLDLAKVESGHIDLSLEPLEVGEVVQECLSLVSALADRRAITLSQSGLQGAAVRADRTRLKQALLNLLSNAIKYNRDGGRVSLDVQHHGNDRLRIRVTDTGPGIPAGRLAQLFQPFNRLGAEDSNIEGTGIGLTFTRRLVEMMGGTVDVTSEPGQGSTFWIELPLETAPHDHADRQEGTGPAAEPSADDAACHTVLYIEDSPANLRLVAQILGRRRHVRLLTAHTSDLGIELARSRRPELVLMDLCMPDMDGFQVLEVLRAEATLRDVPVIAVTANAMPADIERGRAAGFSDYLTKPIDVSEFLETVDRHLSLPPQGPA